MKKKPAAKATSLDVKLYVRISSADLAKLKRAAGNVDFSTWVRSILLLHAAEKVRRANKKGAK